MDPASSFTSKYNKMSTEGRTVSVQLFRFAMLVLVTCRDVSCSTTENANVDLLRFIPSEEQVCCVSRPGLWMDIPGQDNHTGWQRPSMNPTPVPYGIASPEQSPHSSAGCCRTLPINRSLSSLVPQSVQLLLPHRDITSDLSRSQLLRLAHVSSTHRLRLQPLAKQMFSLQTASASSAFLRDNPQLTVTGTGNPYAFPADPRPFLSAPKHSRRSSVRQHRSARLCSGILRLLPQPGPTLSWRRWTKQLSQGLINRLACIFENCRYFSCLPVILHVWSDIAAFPSCYYCTVACRPQRLHHSAGGELDCPAHLASIHPWYRLEAASPGANPSSAKLSLTAHPATQDFNRLEVSSPGPYSLSHETASMRLDLSQVATPSVPCLRLHSRDLGCILSCESIFCGACWIDVHDTASSPSLTTAVFSQIWFRNCSSSYLTGRPWPNAPPMASRPHGPLPKLDLFPGRVHHALTPTMTTVPLDTLTLLFLRLQALSRPPATQRLPQCRHRRPLRPPRLSPIRCSRPRQPSHRTRSLALHRRTQRVLCPAPMFHHPAYGLICSWRGEAGVCTCTFLRARPPPPPPTLLVTNTHSLWQQQPYDQRQRYRRRRHLDPPEEPNEAMRIRHRQAHWIFFDAQQATVVICAASSPRTKRWPSAPGQPMLLHDPIAQLYSLPHASARLGSASAVYWHSYEPLSVCRSQLLFCFDVPAVPCCDGASFAPVVHRATF